MDCNNVPEDRKTCSSSNENYEKSCEPMSNHYNKVANVCYNILDGHKRC